jgi:acyl-coenzyme A synthetase/AMP-(fatty) acid ligase
MITHNNLSHLFDSVLAEMEINETDVWLMSHNHAFDFSVFEMWGALSKGGSVVIAPTQTRYKAPEIQDLIIRFGISVLSQTPTAFRRNAYQLIKSADRNALKLRYIVFGGERLIPSDLVSWIQFRPTQFTKLLNMYGTTETTIHSTIQEISAQQATSSTSIIGRPLKGLQALVIDENRVPVEEGKIGELVLSGPTVSAGYLNKEELTNQRFVEIQHYPSRKFYLTGDLVSADSQGIMTYHGRKDRQVKINGYRIETGEIETHIFAYQDIANCHVCVSDKSIQKLVAFIQTALSHFDPSSLIEYLESKLPYYMIPSEFIVVDTIPMTPNGKIHTEGLLKILAMQGNATQVSPKQDQDEISRDEVILNLIKIWKSLLKHDAVTESVDLYAIGAHSLAMIQALELVTKIYPLEDIDALKFAEGSSISEWADLIMEAIRVPA